MRSKKSTSRVTWPPAPWDSKEFRLFSYIGQRTPKPLLCFRILCCKPKVTCDWPINVWVAQVKFFALFQVLMKYCIFVWPGKKKACSTDTLFRELPVSQWFPLKPAVHKQRYPLSVKPVWQVALFLQGFFAHAFYGRKGRWDWSCTVVTCFHPPNWHFPLSGSHKTFHFSYMKFLCLLKFLFIKVNVSLTFMEKKFRMARLGFNLGASALQSITLTPTQPRICGQRMVWFEYI